MGDDKKHIDRVFQERLKDFEVVPDKMVWNNIEEKLTKNKKRRVIPIWFRYGGAAAALLLFSVIGFQFINKNEDIIKPSIETPVVKEGINPKNKIFNNTEEVVTKTKETPKEIYQKSQEEVLPSSTVNNSFPKTVNSSRNNVVASTVNEDKKEPNEKSLVAQIETKIANEKAKKVTSNLPVKENKNLQSTQETVIASNDKKITKEDIVKAIQETANKDKELIAEATKKWSVGASIAPVQFNTLQDGSPINSSLANNPKNSNTSVAYGIKINYQVNDRLTIQSGINSVDLSYNTESVVAKVYSNELQFASNYIANEANIMSSNSISVSNGSVSNDITASRSAAVKLEGNIDQNFSYVEVPFEAKYALTKTKLGVNLVGGLSTYVLYKNNIILINEDGKKALGEASNLNNFNFSGNVGVDFDYKVNKKIFINMSPMFKYQLNTFSKEAGGFRPYYFGIYTGLNFRF